ncbi:MAG: peptidylprolyl isomerase [Actinomycetota bacterium]
MSRLITFLLALALVAAACGASRESDDVLDADATVTDDGDDVASDDDESADEADSDGDDAAATPTTTAPAPTTPPTTAPAGDVALSAQLGDDTIEITHGQMNDVVVPTTDNQEFVDLVFGGVRPQGFEVSVLTEQLVSEALLLEITDAGGSVSDTDLEDSRGRLLEQVATLFPTAADPLVEAERFYEDSPYLQFLTVYQAGQDVLTATVIDQAEPGEGNPCVSHILLDTEAEADAAIERLADGEDFAELAMELSTGPSGPNGGDLGCAPSTNYVVPFAEAVDAAELGENVGPVETEFGFHVLTVDRYEVDGRTLAADRLRARLAEATVEVDERLGSWDTTSLAIIPAESS